MEQRNRSEETLPLVRIDPLLIQLFEIFPRCNLTEEEQLFVDNFRPPVGTQIDMGDYHYQDFTVYPEFGSATKMEVVNVLPFSNHDNVHLMSFAAFYAFLFIVGTCGNASIIAIINHLRETSRKAKDNSTMVYIWVLCLVDFAAMLPLPMTIMDQVLGFWMFGTAACKLFRLLEHIGKIFSTFILVALSVDRYYAVCHPVCTQIRAKKTVYAILLTLFALTFTLLAPMLYYAHSKELILHQKVNERSMKLTQMRIFKCVDNLGEELFVVFTLYIFFLAYIAPLLLMVFFYYRMISRLFAQTRGNRLNRNQRFGRKRSGSNSNRPVLNRTDDHIPIRRIAIYTLAICTFHFVCWTPYWVSVLYSLYLEKRDGNRAIPSHTFIYFMYGVHALPYINSASNWVLYGLLNKQLHQSTQDTAQVSRRSHGSRSTTNGNTLQTFVSGATYATVNGNGMNGTTVTNGIAMDTFSTTDLFNDDHTSPTEQSSNAHSPFLVIRKLSGRSHSVSCPSRNKL